MIKTKVEEVLRLLIKGGSASWTVAPCNYSGATTTVPCNSSSAGGTLEKLPKLISVNYW